MPPNKNSIVISGAREHNLRDISLSLPRDALVVITGLSGSGKSSLAFDTIYAEGQRRYVESLSAYARQFLGQMDKPDVDSIEGLSPAISIDQKTTSRNPRSTVGTVTEIYDYLRLLWARIGHPHCHICGKPVSGQSAEQIIDQVMELPEGTRFMVMAPVVRGRKGEYGKQLEELRAEGFQRAKVDGEMRMLEDEIVLDKKFKHDISIVIDRLVMRHDLRKRLADSIETAVALADGMVEIETVPREGEAPRSPCTPRSSPARTTGRSSRSSSRGSSRSTRRTARARGAPASGRMMEIDPELVVPDPTLSIGEGALAPWATSTSQYYEQITQAIAEKYRIDLEAPWDALPEDARELFLYGTNGDRIQVSYRNRYGRRRSYATRFEGIVPNLERRYKETESDLSREKIEEFMSMVPCPACKGARLRPESRAVLVGGIALHEFSALSVRRALQWLAEVELTETERHIARLIVREIDERLQLPRERRHRLPVDGPRGGDAVRRRGAADPAGDADRVGARRRAVRPRRAVDRPAPARQLEADRDARAPARRRQHGDRRRARRADDARGRLPRRPGPGRGRARRRDRRAGHGQAGREGQEVADGPVPRGHAHDRRPGGAARADRATSRSAARASTTSSRSTSTCRSAC